VGSAWGVGLIRTRRRITLCLLAWLAIAPGCGVTAQAPPQTPAGPAREPTIHTQEFGEQVQAAYQARRSHVWVEGAGRVERLLRDDTKRPRHQRFIVDLGNGLTVLIAHNIDLASRVPLKKGDVIRFRGEYIWSEQGGTVHWTHRDPKGGKDSGGWIRWRDFVYR
jgi:signal peptidase I